MLVNLKRLREEYGISQQGLADVLHVAQTSINKYENHNTQPELSILSHMADYFNTSIDYIVGRTDVRRRIEPTTACDLNEDELEMITRYRALTQEQKACINTVTETLLK